MLLITLMKNTLSDEKCAWSCKAELRLLRMGDADTCLDGQSLGSLASNLPIAVRELVPCCFPEVRRELYVYTERHFWGNMCRGRIEICYCSHTSFQFLEERGVLVSLGCCNEVSQAAWCKRQKYCFPVLDLDVWNQDVCRVGFFSELWGKDLFQAPRLASGDLLAVSPVPWLVEESPWSLPSSLHGILCACGSVSKLPPFYADINHSGLGPTLMIWFEFDDLCKDPIFRWSYVLRS